MFSSHMKTDYGEDGSKVCVCTMMMPAMHGGFWGFGDPQRFFALWFAHYCSFCGKGDAQVRLLLCARCREVRYCDRNCQRRHWAAGHNLVCRAEPDGETQESQDDGDFLLNVKAFSWRHAVLTKLRAGVKLESIGGERREILHVFYGQTVDRVHCGVVDKDAVALKDAAECVLDIGDGKGTLIRLQGALTVHEVMDRLLRAARGDSVSKVYSASERSTVEDCSLCPAVAFCGIIDTKKNTRNGVRIYKALWSIPHCITGCTQLLQRITPRDLTPEAAANLKGVPTLLR